MHEFATFLFQRINRSFQQHNNQPGSPLDRTKAQEEKIGHQTMWNSNSSRFDSFREQISPRSGCPSKSDIRHNHRLELYPSLRLGQSRMRALHPGERAEQPVGHHCQLLRLRTLHRRMQDQVCTQSSYTGREVYEMEGQQWLPLPVDDEARQRPGDMSGGQQVGGIYVGREEREGDPTPARHRSTQTRSGAQRRSDSTLPHVQIRAPSLPDQQLRSYPGQFRIPFRLQARSVERSNSPGTASGWHDPGCRQEQQSNPDVEHATGSREGLHSIGWLQSTLQIVLDRIQPPPRSRQRLRPHLLHLKWNRKSTSI